MKKYQELEFEIIKFSVNDVMRTSLGGTPDVLPDDFWGNYDELPDDAW